MADDEHAYPVEIDCKALDQENLFHQAVVCARPGRLAEVDRAIRERFPGLAVITAREIEQVIVEISDTERLAWIVVCFWVAAGLAILMTVVAASRNRRLIETGVLCALGATPKMLARVIRWSLFVSAQLQA